MFCFVIFQLPYKKLNVPLMQQTSETKPTHVCDASYVLCPFLATCVPNKHFCNCVNKKKQKKKILIPSYHEAPPSVRAKHSQIWLLLEVAALFSRANIQTK